MVWYSSFINKMKKIIILVLNLINFFWTLIPSEIRKFFIKSILAIESRGNPKKSLKFLFEINELSEVFINQSSIRYEGNHHPKHRLTNYHNFFIKNIDDNSKVLDLGCGYGYVAWKVAEQKVQSKIIGVDRVKSKVDFANKEYNLPNLSFICQDILDVNFSDQYDVIILSNIYEHLDERIKFIQTLVKKFKPKKILFRIPNFERSWFLPLKKELGVNYFSDDEHFIEPTFEEFTSEVEAAGLIVGETEFVWGEIWSVCQINQQ